MQLEGTRETKEGWIKRELGQLRSAGGEFSEEKNGKSEVAAALSLLGENLRREPGRRNTCLLCREGGG